MKKSIGTLLLAILCFGPSGHLSAELVSRQLPAPSYVRAQHKAVIEKWLAASRRRANLRIATDKDCRNKSGLTWQRKDNRNYQPYYAVGDFNHDGREDFAIAFVNDKKQQATFSFAIFNAPFNDNPLAAYSEENVDLGRWVFFWRGGAGNYLLQGEFESDNCVIYRPQGKKYAPKPCLED